MRDAVDLSVILPAQDEGRNLATLLPSLHDVLRELEVQAEVIVVTSGFDPELEKAARLHGAELLEQREPGYGGALRAGFARARGRYVLTLDADLSHPPAFVALLWSRRQEAEILIASRYTWGGSARMAPLRRLLSGTLNRLFSRGLSLRVQDMSSGFRLYDARVLRSQVYRARDFDILQEILVRAYAEGWRAVEIPFHYEPRAGGSSNARVVPFGMSYLRTFFALWRLRNSILCADYDDRAFDSPIFVQRYWQRERFRHVTEFVPAGRVLDVGCGSSRIIAALPPGSVAVDILLRKLRYARRFQRFLAQASGAALPFRDATFPCVVCSQVIEHVPRDSPILDELCRVLAPGGRLVLGTPDYGGWQWPAIEAIYARVAPGAYADEHITHYTRQELIDLFRSRGYRLLATRSILEAEVILVFEKPADDDCNTIPSGSTLQSIEFEEPDPWR